MSEVNSENKTSSEVWSEAASNWFVDFRAHWSELSDDIFNTCYSQACERGELYGYDEVAAVMDSVVDFAKKF